MSLGLRHLIAHAHPLSPPDAQGLLCLLHPCRQDGQYRIKLVGKRFAAAHVPPLAGLASTSPHAPRALSRLSHRTPPAEKNAEVAEAVKVQKLPTLILFRGGKQVRAWVTAPLLWVAAPLRVTRQGGGRPLVNAPAACVAHPLPALPPSCLCPGGPL